MPRPPYRPPSRFAEALNVLAGGAVVGAIVGINFLWMPGESFRLLVASIVAGVSAGVVCACAMVLGIGARGWGIHAIFAASGAGGGLAWWAVVRPELGPAACAAIGAGITTTVMFFAMLKSRLFD